MVEGLLKLTGGNNQSSLVVYKPLLELVDPGVRKTCQALRGNQFVREREPKQVKASDMERRFQRQSVQWHLVEVPVGPANLLNSIMHLHRGDRCAFGELSVLAANCSTALDLALHPDRTFSVAHPVYLEPVVDGVPPVWI